MTRDIRIRFERDGVDWAKAAEIFERAPLGTREPEVLRRSFENSDLTCFAWDGDELVGIARALSDGLVQSVIYDLCLLPEHQSMGLGSRMMEAMLERLNTATTVLWAVPGKEGFYARFGFCPLLTAMALVEDPQRSASQGYIRL